MLHLALLLELRCAVAHASDVPAASFDASPNAAALHRHGLDLLHGGRVVPVSTDEPAVFAQYRAGPEGNQFAVALEATTDGSASALTILDSVPSRLSYLCRASGFRIGTFVSNPA